MAPSSNNGAIKSAPLSNSQKKKFLRAREGVKIHNTTAFRESERYYKSRVPGPSYELVLDVLDRTKYELYDVKEIQLICPLYKLSNLYGQSDVAQTAYIMPSHPGFVIIPNAFTIAAQRHAVKCCLNQAKAPNINNLDTHYEVPREGIWQGYLSWSDGGRKDGLPEPIIPTKAILMNASPESETASKKSEMQDVETGLARCTTSGGRQMLNLEPMTPSQLETAFKASKSQPPPATTLQPESVSSLIRKLRWTTIGLQYHWPTKSYYWDQLHDPTYNLPSDFHSVATAIVKCIPWSQVFSHQDSPPDYSTWASTYAPSAGIVNHYQASKDTLMAHIDQSEADSVRPLVSYSIGHSAVFLLGGRTRDTKPVPILVRSGDMLIMSGETRRAFHGVPRILEEAPVDLEWNGNEDVYRAYMNCTRINVNIRQAV